ncbi:glutamine ABC transporter substrate-binding protein, partial [Lactobacillus delbrueckii subsp. bulgaricus]
MPSRGPTSTNGWLSWLQKASVKQFDDYGSAFNALKAGQGDVMIDDNGILAGLIADTPEFTLTK